MTSEEIRKEMKGPITNLVTDSVDASVAFWLAEIAYQLAVMNEREAAKAKAESVSVKCKGVAAWINIDRYAPCSRPARVEETER